MHLFLIFALICTLSAQQNLPGINAGGIFSSNEVEMPFKNTIPGGLKPKMTFIIRGFIPNKASSIVIDFMADSDVALHINPRMDEGTIVRNSFLKGNWGPEERDLPFNPFKIGKYFELTIHCGKYQFIVYANDEFLFSYTHRYINLPLINVLLITGDVILSYVQY